MNIVIPLGGVGQRFGDKGYLMPKPLIKVEGKEIIRWLIDSIKFRKNDIVIIIYHPVLTDFKFKEFINSYYSNIKLIELKNETLGACDTISKAFTYLSKKNDDKLLILDGDNFFQDDIITKAHKSKKDKIFYFQSLSKDPIYSYIQLKGKKVINIEEKVKISNYASVGAYFFRSTKKAIENINDVLKKTSVIKEYYLSVAYKELLLKNQIIEAEEIREFTCFGTPDLINKFKSFEKKRVCFDLDNTLTTFPKKIGDYKTCKPIHKNIEFLQNLKKNGHYIIIYTARRMKTHSNNIEEVIKDIKKLTVNQLKRFKIPYDELHFGKPYADLYIDDLAISSHQNLNKGTGFYFFENDINARKFNKLELKKKIITKTSKNLTKIRSEILYYKSLPIEIRNNFPSIIKFSKNSYSYEYIDGSTFSELFIKKKLTTNHVELIIKCLDKIHNFPIKKSSLDIYFNYKKKINNRIKNNEIILNKSSMELYKNIIEQVDNYKLSSNGKIGIIHGDTVFTNIIINSKNKIYFIDPRGIVGKKYTIF